MVHGRVDVSVRGPLDAIAPASPVAVGAGFGGPRVTVTSTTPGGTTSAVYGPNGAEWAPNTPPDTTTFNVTVSSLSGLVSALAGVSTAQANSGTYSIGILPCDLAPTAAVTIPEQAALKAASRNILVRAVTPGTVKASNTINLQCSRVTLAYLDLYAGFGFDTSPYNSWLLRCHGIGSAHINLSTGQSDSSTVPGGADCGIMGLIYPDATAFSGDRIHISPKYSGTGHTPGHAMHNFTVSRCWMEGMPLPSGSTAHADMMQIDGLTGTYFSDHTYYGPAGNNGTSQVKADIFNYAIDPVFCSLSYDTCAFGGAYIYGQGNSTSQSGPDTRTNCLFWQDGSSNALRFNGPLVDTGGASTTPQVTLTGNTFIGGINFGTSGFSVANYPNNTYLPDQDPYRGKPALILPGWAWW